MSAAEFRTSKTTLEVVGDKVYATLAISSRKSAGPKRHDVTRLLSTDPARLASYDGVEATVGWTSDGHIIRVTPLDGFLNPYAFISIPDRAELPAVLGDGEPVGHDRYRPDRWTGTIPVIMTTRTPLLLPDHARAAAEDEAGALPVRVDHERRPILAGSAIKGLLRSSYEAITNSRFGVFAGHDRPLATRGTLRRNDTLYVELAKGGTVTSLYPAMIGRKPFPGAPVLSLPEEHHPATELGQLSPADRVFGWVPDGGDERGHRGHLRVIPPDGDDRPGPGCVRTFARPVPLTVLNSPKPSQFLFYLGNADGSPRHGAAKEPTEGYPATPGERRLRGRKVYLTHAEVLDDQPGAAEYWTPPEGVPGKPTPLTVGGRQRYREYVRYQKPATDGKAEEPNDEVTTWISGWVEPGTTFRFTLHVDNLSDTELGALLWLLILPEKATLKLGLGKPLGFGAVGLEVDWDGVRLFTGDRLLDRYRTLRREPAPAALDEVKALRDAYDRLLHEYLPQVRTEFLNAAQGLAGVPVHYPRADNESGTVRLAGQPSEPRTTSYDWWVENDRVRKEGAYRHALGELADFESLLLPYHPPKQKSDKKQGRDGRDEHAEDGRANSGGLGAQGQRWPGSNRRRDSRSDSTGPHNQRRRGGGSRRH